MFVNTSDDRPYRYVPFETNSIWNIVLDSSRDNCADKFKWDNYADKWKWDNYITNAHLQLHWILLRSSDQFLDLWKISANWSRKTSRTVSSLMAGKLWNTLSAWKLGSRISILAGRSVLATCRTLLSCTICWSAPLAGCSFAMEL